MSKQVAGVYVAFSERWAMAGAPNEHVGQEFESSDSKKSSTEGIVFQEV
jgi:hypothetical protein